MKWSKEQENQLIKLAFEGTSNKEIAEKIGCSLSDVYGKRSQLGITIDKVQEVEPPEVKKINTRGLSREVVKAFDDIFNALLIDMARDRNSIIEANILSSLAELIQGIEENYDDLLREVKGA